MALRRAPAAVVSSLLMDHTLCTLFVEGRTDRLFMRWILGDGVVCQTHEIQSVEILVDAGGNRARAICLADHLKTQLESCEAALDRVRVLIDADFSHFDGEVAPLPLMFTDGRSLESYFLRLDCFEKMFALAIMAEHVDSRAVFEATTEVTMLLAAAREVDRRRALELPFGADRLKSFIDIELPGLPSLRLHDMLCNLLLDAGMPVSGAPALENAVEEVLKEIRSHDPLYVVHGHDLECVLGEIFQSLDYPRAQVSQLMRSTFERSYVSEYPVLSAIELFATTAR